MDAEQSQIMSLSASYKSRRISSPKKAIRHQLSSIIENSDHKESEVLGSNTDLEVETNLLHALHFGPEQTVVYSRGLFLQYNDDQEKGFILQVAE